MAEVVPFNGLRYQASKVGDIGNVIAPPFDVITSEQQIALHDRSPYNVVRLEYGLTGPNDSESDNRYTRAAAALDEWRGQGVLSPDTVSSFYLYEQVFEQRDKQYRRHALIGRVRLEEWESGVVRPHEFTLSKPKEDRIQLLRACRTQVSPVFGLYDDTGNEIRGLIEQASGEEVVAAQDSTGQTHRLRTITDRAAQDAIVRLFQDKRLTIADGHHRYETALAYRAERRASSARWTGDELENLVMMGLTAVDDPGLLVLPIHRLLHTLLPSEFLQRLSEHFQVEKVDGEVDALLAKLAEIGDEATAFGMTLSGADDPFVLTLTDREVVYGRMPSDSPSAWRRLDVNVLQYGVFDRILGIDSDSIAKGDAVEFTENAREAVRAVRGGQAQAAFLLNPTQAKEVLAVADAGWRMPQKSTFFYPKLGTGLVLNSLES